MDYSISAKSLEWVGDLRVWFLVHPVHTYDHWSHTVPHTVHACHTDHCVHSMTLPLMASVARRTTGARRATTISWHFKRR